ncbi:Two-component response regulator ARR1 [Phytophthora nicotianae]|uniref:Two-component response regulator ARR1 n=2 Tax=Phytophthora nicotianae TaxID=4792 RepID=A0A0W8CCN9_PHYNI|nr:Two-component response regulator ARR1 [Phytophthora nicotianae]
MGQTRSPSPTSSDTIVSVMPNIENIKASAVDKQPRKKNKRPSKRFLWQEDLHLRFVAAIFDLGLKNASPKTLLPLMNKSDPDSGLTTEHLKSHLQKYRINYERSREEFQRLCDREVKRDRKRRRQLDSYSESDGSDKPLYRNSELADAGSVADSSYSYEYLSPQQAPVSSGMPELTDAQWRTFSMLMSAPPIDDSLSVQIPQETPSPQILTQDNLHMQMHQAMQAQMSFHREMLARKVQLSNDLYHCEEMETWSRNHQVPGDGSVFQQAWANTQQIHQRQLASHRLQRQMNQFEAPLHQRPSAPSEVPAASLPSLVAEDQIPHAKGDTGLNRWDLFNVSLDDDELFEFLKA